MRILYIVVITLVATLGGLLFGYDTAVIAGAIGFLEVHFELDKIMMGWAGSSALVGCIIGAACAGMLSDRFGRRSVMMLAGLLFFISAIGSAIPRNLTEFIIARIIGGIGVGAASMLSPLYIAEIAPANIRGRLVSLNQFAIIFGMLVVYFVNAKIAHSGNDAWNIARGWRWMFGSEAIPAALFFGLLFLVPESPRWLFKQNRGEKARQVLSRIMPSEKIESSVAEIKQTLAQETGSIIQIFHPGMRIALLIGVGLAILQQITGINVVLYYAPEIFKSTGLSATEAIDSAVIIPGIMLLFTIVAIWIVDRVGRKPLLLIASAGMALSLGLLGAAFFLEKFEGRLVLFCVLGYVAFFSVAMGPVVWVVLAELFPTRIRGRAMSIATFFLWFSNYLVSQFFPYMLETMKGNVFFFYAFMCVIAVIFIWLLIPETKEKSLEEIEQYWLAKEHQAR
jgi:sugar porter (SP) family MFS transporter